MKFTKWLSITIITLILLCGLFAGCDKKPADDATKPPTPPQPAPSTLPAPPSPAPTPSAPAPTEILKGITLSPKTFGPNDFSDFLEKAKLAGKIVSWAGDWNDLSTTTDSAPKVVAELASKYNYLPVVEAQFFTQSSGKLLRTLDTATKLNYKNRAVAFAQKYNLKYLAFGIEVNILYEKSPEDFNNFILFFAEVYDAVKAASPNTRVFTIFQLEKMKGLNGGLFGGVNEPSKTQWQLLDKFPRSDIIAFTTYPGLIYKSPNDIPVDYYSDIKSHTSKPIAFTEIGWHSADNLRGWESSEVEQADFVTKFFNLTKGLDREMVIWSFMYDQNTIEPFKSMGLRRIDGNARLAWDEWIKTK